MESKASLDAVRGVRFGLVSTPTVATRGIMQLWAARRRGNAPPRRDSFTTDDLARWAGGLLIVDETGATPRVEVYSPSLALAIGAEIAGLPLPEWPTWIQMMGMRTSARLRGASLPFLERVQRPASGGVRLYDRLVLPLADRRGHNVGWLGFIDNRRDVLSAPPPPDAPPPT